MQHLGGRGLLFQRLPLLGQQPCVLDRDHRLVGEGADQFDLTLRERFDPLACQYNASDCLTFTHQWHSKRSSLPTKPDRRFSVAWNGGHVVNVDGAAFAYRPGSHILGRTFDWEGTQASRVTHVFRREAEARH